jgi:hypothetical protein
MTGSANWPVGRVLALIGAIIGIVLGALAVAGAGAGYFANMGSSLLGTGVVGAVATVGVVNIVLAILCLIDIGLMPGNPRTHGGLCVLWGVIGLFFGFGVWIGALLVIVGGVLTWMHSAPVTGAPRRPAV